jgi:hypothetical protein
VNTRKKREKARRRRLRARREMWQSRIGDRMWDLNCKRRVQLYPPFKKSKMPRQGTVKLIFRFEQ